MYCIIFFFGPMHLLFLQDASDRVELEDRENGSELIKALQNVVLVILVGIEMKRWKYDSAHDLLQVIRNKLNHYRELPQEIQVCLLNQYELLISTLVYFTSRDIIVLSF